MEKMDTSGIWLSVIMPAFNEGDRIRANIDATIDILDKFDMTYELIVVNDGSTDDTENEIRTIQLIHPEIVLVTYSKNGGKGNALKEGWKHVKGNWVSFVDSDLEINPSQLSGFFNLMTQNNADIVIGSKRHPESIIHYPVKRRILSKCYNVLIRAVFGIKLSDTQPGLKLFKKDVLDKEFPKVFVKRYAFDLELLVNAINDGYHVCEAPIEINFVRENGGRIKIGDVWNIFRDTMGIFYRVRISHYYDKSISS